MKIIHCADIHLGSSMNSNLIKEKAKERKNELYDNFARLVEYANDNEVAHIIIAGDLFDFIKGNTALVKKTISLINKNSEVSFYYLQGNHDSEILINYEIPNNLFLFADEFKLYNLGNVSIGGMMKIIPSEAKFKENKFNILVLHGNVVNSKPNDEIDINLSYFKNKNINYIALGHIHKRCDYKVDENLYASYSGCLEGRGFDELGEKGFYLLDINEEQKCLKQTFVPFSKRICHEIEVDITNCKDYMDIVSRIKENARECKATDLVKIKLLGEYDINLDKNLSTIINKMENNYYCFKIEDNSKLRIDYNDYINEVSILGEFVRTVLKDESLTNKDEVLILGIKALRGEDI